MISIQWNGEQYKVSQDGSYQPPQGAAFSPMNALCEALGMCIAVSVIRLMEHEKMDSTGLEVHVEPHKAQVGAPRVESINVQVTFPTNVLEEMKEKLVVHASRICTIGNTLKRGSEIEYKFK